MKLVTHQSALIGAIVAAAVALVAVPAWACSYAPAAWSVAHRGTTLITPPEGPLAVVVQGWGNPSEPLPDLTSDTFTVELVAGDGSVVPGVLEIADGLTEADGRLLFTPDAPLEIGGEYTFSITSVFEFAGTVTLPLDVLASLGGLEPQVSWLSTTEVSRGRAEVCCATPPTDFTCTMDSCGDYSYGEACKLCWDSANAYPIVTSVRWVVASDLPAGYLTHTVYRVAGADEEIVAEFLAPGTAGTEWPEDDAGPFCMRVEITDVVRGGSASSETLCVEASDIDRVERQAPDTSAFEARCEPGTIEEQPDPEDPIDPADPELPEDPGGAGASDDKSEPGCCATTRSPVGGGGAELWIGAALLLMARRRQ